MKKLHLQALQLGATEVLSRSQMKNVMGGSGSPQPCFQDSNCSSGHCIGGYCSTGSGGCGSCPPPMTCTYYLGQMQCN